MNMPDVENETHSAELPVLQPHPPTHFVNKKACSSQKQQEKPDLKTCLNNSFQLFVDTLLRRKVLPEPILKGRGLGKIGNLMMRAQPLNRHQIQKKSLRNW